MAGRQGFILKRGGGGGGGEAEMTLWFMIFEDCMKHVYSQVNTFLLLRTSSCHEPKSRERPVPATSPEQTGPKVHKGRLAGVWH